MSDDREPAGSDQPTYGLQPRPAGDDSPQAERNSRGPLIGAGLIVVLLVIGVVGFFVTRSLGDDEPSTITGTAAPTASDSSGGADAAVPGPATDSVGTPVPGMPSGAGDDSTAGGAAGSGGAASEGSQPAAAVETIDAYAVKLGDCLVDPGSASTVTKLGRLPCNQPHDVEVFAIYKLSQVVDAPYPGDAQVQQAADDGCGDRFTEFVGVSPNDTTLDYGLFAPTEQTWKTGDREVVCQVFDPDRQTTGSLKGANR